MLVRKFLTLMSTPLLALALSVTPTATASEDPVPDDATSYGSVVIEDDASSSTAGSELRPAGLFGSYWQHVDGGTWYYGTDWSVVWSNFYHPTRCHGSSVRTYNGLITVRSARTAPGRWSHAQVRRSTDTNEAYYWFC